MSDTVTLTLTDFLLARIAEDEANIDGDWASGDGGLHIIGSGMHDRMVAECEAKRRIAEGVKTADEADIAPLTQLGGAALDAVRLLAIPYADHPDYDEEWRP